MKVTVLGATRGMGRAPARRMAERGDRLFLLEHVPDELERSARDLEIRGAAGPVGTAVCDLLEPETFGPALDAAEKELDGLETVVVTAALFTGWFMEFYEAANRPMAPALLWLGGFYLVFLVLPFLYNLRHRAAAAVERFGLAVGNATFAFAFAYRMLYPEHEHALGHVALGMAAAYAALGWTWRTLIPSDNRAQVGFTALAMMFATITVPLHLGLNGITLAWGAEAAVLVYLGCRYRYWPLRAGGGVVLLLTLGRLISRHWPLHIGPFEAPFINASYAVAMWVPLAAWACATVLHRRRSDVTRAESVAKVCIAIAAGILALAITGAETTNWYRFVPGLSHAAREYSTAGALAAVWTAGAIAFLAAGVILRCEAARWTNLACLLLAFVFVRRLQGCNTAQLPMLFILNARFTVSLLCIAALWGYALAMRIRPRLLSVTELLVPAPAGILGGLLLPALLSCEIHWGLGRIAGLPTDLLEYYRMSVIATLWAIGVAAFLAAGVALRCAAVRCASFVCLAVAVVCAWLLQWCYTDYIPMLFILNARFAASLLCVAAIWGYVLLARVRADVLAPEERRLPMAAGIAGGLALLILVTCETGWGIGRIPNLPGGLSSFYRYSAFCVLWTAGAMAYLGAALRLPSRRCRAVSELVRALGILFGMSAYFCVGEWEFLPVLNVRFAAGLIAVGALFATAWAVRRTQSIARLIIAACVLLFMLLSAEPAAYWAATVSDPDTCRWLTQMSLSIVWGAYASALLMVGFRWNVRPLRLSALGLFGVTALKLVIVDLSTIGAIYRIASFLALGVLMIGASYLYHRAEKKLPASQEAEALEDEKADG